MVELVGPPKDSVRNRPIIGQLESILKAAANATDIDRIVVVSGGQTANHAPNLENVVGGWTGSRRHDNGRAADIILMRKGAALTFTDSEGSAVAPFITAVAARGLNGIGAGVHYMGNKTIHVGFGNSPSDTDEIVWGAGGHAVNAPAWLRTAAKAGWDAPVGMVAPLAVTAPVTTVAARGGAWLRLGPGLEFEKSRLLAAGTSLSIRGHDGPWARVDLQGDGLIDGHIHSAFLSRDPIAPNVAIGHEVLNEPDPEIAAANSSPVVVQPKAERRARTKASGKIG